MSSIDILPFELSDYIDDATNSGTDNTAILGKVFQVDDKWYRAVRMNLAAGIAPAARVFSYTTSATAATRWDVEPCDTDNQLVCGVGPTQLTDTVPDNAIFLVQIWGDAEVTLSEDGDTVTAGLGIAASDDTDLGKVILASDQTLVAADINVVFAYAIDATSTADAQFTVRIARPLG